MPGQAKLYLPQAAVYAAGKHLANRATVTVELFPFDLDFLAERAVRHGLLRALPKSLLLLGSVNARNPHPRFLPVM